MSNFWKSLIYWTGATTLVVILLFGIFYLAALSSTLSIPFYKLWASLFIISGIILIIITLKKPSLLFYTFFLKQNDTITVNKDNQPINPIFLMIYLPFGIGFTIGGIIYSYTGNVYHLILPFVIAAIWLRVFVWFLDLKKK